MALAFKMPATQIFFESFSLVKDPMFHIGDRIEFELAKDGTPRWNTKLDQGGTGKWGTGSVLNFTQMEGGSVPFDMVISYNFQGRLRTWRVPLLGHQYYSKDQWGRPGYFCHTRACHCGAKHTSAPNLHLGYCPRYEDPRK